MKNIEYYYDGFANRWSSQLNENLYENNIVKLLIVSISKDSVIENDCSDGYLTFMYNQYSEINLPNNHCSIIGKFSELSNEECVQLIYSKQALDDITNYCNYGDILAFRSAKDSLKSLLISNDLWLKDWIVKPETIWEAESESQAGEIADLFLDYEEKLNKASEDFLIIKIKIC